jgi:hypothetical protein
MTNKEFILSKMLLQKREADENPTEHLMRSENNAARLREAISTPASEHRVFESIDDLKNALGI